MRGIASQLCFFQVAERRKNEIGAFLLGLFRLADEISHSDIVYTFFHPLHRDQKEANIHINKLKGDLDGWSHCRPYFGKYIFAEPKGGHQRKPSTGRICGKVKLSVSYKQDTLLVMVHHIQNLSFTDPSRVSEMVVKFHFVTFFSTLSIKNFGF